MNELVYISINWKLRFLIFVVSPQYLCVAVTQLAHSATFVKYICAPNLVKTKLLPNSGPELLCSAFSVQSCNTVAKEFWCNLKMNK